MKTTCICILNYNNGRKTTRCISGVLRQTLQDYRMIIIDNGSTDDSLDVIQAFFAKEQVPFRIAAPSDDFTKNRPDPGEALVVKSGRNGGYSYGNNTGIRLAKSLNMFCYLLIINNDVVLKENFLEETVKHYEKLRRSFGTAKIALGATELGKEGNVHHKGFHYLHLLSGITFASPFFPSFKYIVGSCIFTGIDAPLLDESFFLYFDDTQYSKILRKNGYILETSPGSSFVHEVGGTVNGDLQGLIFKSLRRFFRLNYPFLLPVVVPLRLLLVIYLRIKKKKQTGIS